MDEKKISVLTCDDSAFVRMMVKDILEKSDFDCIGEATNGIQAVEAFQRLKPDVMLLDIVMPEMDGLEAARQILDQSPGFPIVVMSERTTASLIAEAVKLGARGFVTKPFSPQTLLKELRQALTSCEEQESPRPSV